MKTVFKRITLLTLTLAALLALSMSAAANAPTTKTTILFTHDLHSHLLPAADEEGGEYGGYARLKTVIDQQKALYPDAILVDGGDFSMGSLFQTAYATSAIELRMMGAMGYDVTTFGNHEYDYRASGFASMLNAAVEAKEATHAALVSSQFGAMKEYKEKYGPETLVLPAIVEANYKPPLEGEEGYDADAKAVWDAFENYGVADYVILQRGGVYYVIFGIFGEDSDACAPNSGMVFYDPAETAQAIVNEATAFCWENYGVQPLVVCLSHSGTEGGEGEDYELAQKVDGIHLIVSGHTHTTLHEPIQVENTWIVSAGEYGKYLGVVQMDYKPNGESVLTDYELIPIDETMAEDADTAAMVEEFKASVEEDYLSNYGVGFDEVLTQNPYKFDTVDEVYATQHESTLCNVFSDAYKWAAEQATGETVDLALTAAGVIRESLPVGDVTVSDVFNAASLGVGTEGELVLVYLTGADLKNVLEVDASVQPLMRAAQLFCSGVEYSFNTNRMIFNKVDYAMLRRADGTLEAIEDEKLYRVVTGMYCGEMLGAVESKSFGLLTVTARDANGAPIDMSRLVDYVVRDAEGKPVKEWYAIASYLQEMDGEMDEQYATPDGRKVVYSSFNPIDLVKNANKFTYIALAVVVLLLVVVILIIRAIVRPKRSRRSRKNLGYQPYRGK